MNPDPTRRTIVLGPRAHELRAYIGPTAWAVLEEMMQCSIGDGDHVVAQVSIRSLATSLGLANDTVARAVRRLRDLGVLAAVQARSSSGVFEAGSYCLAVPAPRSPPSLRLLPVRLLPAGRRPAARPVSSRCSPRSESPSSVRPSLRSSFFLQTGARARS